MPEQPVHEPSDELDSLQTALLWLSEDGVITRLNSAAESLLGHSRKRLLGTVLSEWLSSDNPLFALLDRAQRDQTVLQSSDVALFLPVQITHWLHVLVTPTSTGLLVEMQNADDAHRLSRASEHAKRRREWLDVLRQLAHEIKNPLAGLRGAAQLLARELPDANLQEYTDLIVREADRLRGLVERMLLPARPQQKALVNVHVLLDEALQLQAVAFPGLRIERDYDPSLPELYVLRDALSQVCVNLLQNAAEASDGKGLIRVRTRAQSGLLINATRVRLGLCIEIHDNGAGVPEALQESLFLPLVTGKTSGTGLGLAIAQTLVQEHQGEISFESTAGQTMFCINLPMVTP